MVVTSNMLIPLNDQYPRLPDGDNLASTGRSVQLPAEIGLQVPDPVPGALWIPLRNRCGTVVAYTLIDDRDADLATLRWHRLSGYAHRAEWHHGRPVSVFLHRVILGAPPELECDHINRVRLDNRRSNLRLATRSQNARNSSRSKSNTSGYKGVRYDDSSHRWSASVTFEGTPYPLGLFATPAAAAFAYDFAAIALHGEFAASNFQLAEATKRHAVEFGSFLTAHRTGRTV